MSRRVLRWSVPVDGGAHWVGSGEVLYVGIKAAYTESFNTIVTGTPTPTPAEAVELWTLEDEHTTVERGRAVQVFATGDTLPAEAHLHLGTALDLGGALVWHLFQMEVPE